jgi:hypothetical protein
MMDKIVLVFVMCCGVAFLMGVVCQREFFSEHDETIDAIPDTVEVVKYRPPEGWIDLFDLECRLVEARDSVGRIVR